MIPKSAHSCAGISWRTLTAVLCSALCAGSVLAVVRTVDDNDPGADFSTIQAAIAASSGGDTVMVSCGLYVENISMKDQVNVLGAGADCTILDGNLNGSVVTFSFVDAGTELSGFTIRNGRSLEGGGIYLSNSNPTISRNIITGNSAVQNMSGYAGYGGGLSAYKSSPVITSNLFVGNSSEGVGGAISAYLSSATPINNVVIVNNTIVGNDVTRPGAALGLGGGIYSLYSTLTIRSNIIFNNTAEGVGGGIELFDSPHTAEYNDLFQNSPADWNCSGSCGPLAPSNLFVDPLLQDASPTSRCPRSHSPLIDAGAPTAPPDPTDIHGRPRVQDGDFDGTALVDMGYCETSEISGLRFVGTDDLSWDPGRPGVTYHLYRGLLSELLLSCATSCVYSQDTGAVAEAEQACNLGSPGRTDMDTPPASDAYYYLVTGKNSVEGGLGWRGATPRSHDHPCP